MARFEICATYSAGTSGHAEFPEGKTWDDVSDWYVKWDTLRVKFKDSEEWDEFCLDSYMGHDLVDWKRPIHVSIHPVQDDDSVDYDTDLS